MEIDGWSTTGIQRLDKLTMLCTLRIGYCSGVDELLDMQSLSRLQSVIITESEFKDLSGLSNLDRVPMNTLSQLEINGCSKLRALSNIGPLEALTGFKVGLCNTLVVMPDLEMF